MATYKTLQIIANWIFGPLTIAKIFADFGGWQSILLMCLMAAYWIVSIGSKISKEWDAHKRRKFDMEKDRYDFEKKSKRLIDTFLHLSNTSSC